MSLPAAGTPGPDLHVVYFDGPRDRPPRDLDELLLRTGGGRTKTGGGR